MSALSVKGKEKSPLPEEARNPWPLAFCETISSCKRCDFQKYKPVFLKNRAFFDANSFYSPLLPMEASLPENRGKSNTIKTLQEAVSKWYDQ